jgi:hypothetical protein
VVIESARSTGSAVGAFWESLLEFLDILVLGVLIPGVLVPGVSRPRSGRYTPVLVTGCELGVRGRLYGG